MGVDPDRPCGVQGGAGRPCRVGTHRDDVSATLPQAGQRIDPPAGGRADLHLHDAGQAGGAVGAVHRDDRARLRGEEPDRRTTSGRTALRQRLAGENRGDRVEVTVTGTDGVDRVATAATVTSSGERR